MGQLLQVHVFGVEELQELGWGCSIGLVTLFVTRKVVMTEDMFMKLVWMNNITLGNRGLETLMVTKQGVNMVEV